MFDVPLQVELWKLMFKMTMQRRNVVQFEQAPLRVTDLSPQAHEHP